MGDGREKKREPKMMQEPYKVVLFKLSAGLTARIFSASPETPHFGSSDTSPLEHWDQPERAVDTIQIEVHSYCDRIQAECNNIIDKLMKNNSNCPFRHTE